MDRQYLYMEIAEYIRGQIIDGTILPGEKLPPVRELKEQWHCTPGTIQRAYRVLADEGVLVSRTGQGTRVVGAGDRVQATSSIRKAAMVNKAESFLLEAIALGYSESDIEKALHVAIDRWRSVKPGDNRPVEDRIRFSGSHDPVFAALVRNYSSDHQQDLIEVHFCGSLGGLIDLSQGHADVAGCHLWDELTNTYNIPFIQKIFPGQKVFVINLAIRKIGIALAPGNPLQISSLEHVTRDGVIWVDRQPGSGIRVWVDSQFKIRDIPSKQINRYHLEALTHGQVAKLIAEGSANMGCCLEVAAREFNLDFIPLTNEVYDLITLHDIDAGVLKRFIAFLKTKEVRDIIANYIGYDASRIGEISIVQ